ncbi:MAG: methyl-accepting chemotaxis protein [Lysobacterales bacterium]|jgi:methyl-accepting chemotaxis protein
MSRSIQARSTLILGALATLSFALATVLIQDKAGDAQAMAASRELAAIAEAQAGRVQRLAEVPLFMSRALAASARAEMLSEAPSRPRIVEVVRQHALSDPSSLGYWIEFERDGFDGLDAESPPDVGLGVTDSGRLSIYWVRDESGEVTLEDSTGTENDTNLDEEAYYSAARSRGAEMMFEPYPYEVFGREVLMTSLMVPILIDGQHRGVAGADVTLEGMQRALGEVRPFGSGVLRLFSPSGKVMAAPETELLGQDWPVPRSPEERMQLAQGKRLVIDAEDSAVGGTATQVFLPFRVGAGSDVFVLQVSAPVDVVMASVAEVRNRILLIGLFSVLVLVAAVTLIIRRFVGQPLASAVQSVERLAAGDFDARIDATTDDEVGRLGKALTQMRDLLRAFMHEQSELSRRHAEGELSLRVEASRYRGAFGGMAAGVNRLVDQHIATSGQIIDVVQAYARGDLSPSMPELAGEMRRYSEAVAGVRSNLTAMRDEILRLSRGAAAGDFHLRGDAGRFQHAFREMVDALNALMENADSGLSRTCEVLGAIAQGDLRKRIEGDASGRFAELQASTNATADALRGILGEIHSAVDAINSAASEIAAGNADLSARTEQQAASLEETAASMEELTSTVRGNAENARSANQLAIGAGDVAERGGSVVREVVDTMGQIHAQSRKIEDIIGVIDGIAFQTNILALNAAVEAARAGEQGRGFAVVAGEVRTLAQRSAAAAREIKQLISETVQRVDSGSQLVDSAGATMADILSAVKRVTDIMGEISAASAEQTAGIEQVSATVTHMDEATQQNAALVEEATAAARALEDQAGRLAQNVARFRL